MSKTLKRIYDSKLTYKNIYEAYKRAAKGKKYRPEVIKFEMDLENNLYDIYLHLKNEDYKFGSYREFTIYDPKERLIRTLPFKDRIVHQWYIEEFIKPYFYKRFIYNNYACLDNKGGLKAVNDLQKMI